MRLWNSLCFDAVEPNVFTPINYIYSIISLWNIIGKTHQATWGLKPASTVSVVNRHAIYAVDHHASPKKGCIKPRVKQHCLFPFVQC